MALYHLEQWDVPTAPALPSGWSTQAAITTDASGSSPTPYSSPNVITSAQDDSTQYPLTWQTADTNNGDVVVTGIFQFVGSPISGTTDYCLLARGNSSSLSYSTSNFYEMRISHRSSLHGSDTVALSSWSAGTKSAIATNNPLVFTTGRWYQVTFTVVETALSVAIQDTTNNEWMNSAGNFQTAYVTVLSATDTSIAGSGYAGLAMATATSGDAVYGDDWSFAPFLLATTVPTWPSFAAVARRNTPDAYGGIVIPLSVVPPAVTAYPSWPDFARGPRRATSDQYGGMQNPQIADANQPPGVAVWLDRISWPGLTAAPGRTANTAYQAGQLIPEDADLLMPARPVWPDFARTSQRSTADAYQMSTKQPVPNQTAMGAPITFPSSARGPSRLADYTVITTANLSDATQPPGVAVWLDRTSWPGLTHNTLRAPITEYRYANPGPAQIIPPPIIPSIFPTYPDFARAPARAVNTMYVGLFAVPEIGDKLMPVARPVYPDRTTAAARASSTAYAGLLSALNPAGEAVFRRVHYPDSAPGAPRGPLSNYVVVASPIPTGGSLSRRPSFPDHATSARRTSPTAYDVPQRLLTNPAPATSGRPVFPDQARAPQRATQDAYKGLLAYPNPAAGAIYGRTYFPVSAPSARRASYDAYSITIHPGGADLRMPSGQPVVPDRALAARRNTPDTYKGLLSPVATPDAKQPPGQPTVSLPQRQAARASQDAYKGLVSPVAIADAHQPSGQPVYPQRAPSPVRAPVNTYISTNKIATSQIFPLTVDANIKFVAYVSDAPIYILTVSANLNFSASVAETTSARYRYGDLVPFVFVAPSGTMLTPNPTLNIVADGSSAILASFPLWTWDGGQTYQADVLLTQVFPLSRLIGSAVLLTTTGSYMVQQAVDLVAGGDVGSTVISVYAHEGVAGRATLAQLRSGELVQGSEPWI